MDYLYLPKVDLHVYLNMQVKSGELTRLSHKANIWSQWHSIKVVTGLTHSMNAVICGFYIICFALTISSFHSMHVLCSCCCYSSTVRHLGWWCVNSLAQQPALARLTSIAQPMLEAVPSQSNNALFGFTRSLYIDRLAPQVLCLGFQKPSKKARFLMKYVYSGKTSA